MARKTRKHSSKALTIPQLRKSFDHIDSWVESHLSKKALKDLVPAFQAEWKKTFHHDVNAKAAEAYLAIKHRSGSKKTKKQRGGGAVLAGAPLDYTTRQGVYGVYGNFPQYVSSGLSFYNQINQDSLTAACGTENITPKLPADMGSNEVQKGGKRKGKKSRKSLKKGGKTRKQRGGASQMQNDLAAVRATLDVIGSRPIPNTVPPTSASIYEMGLKGVTVGPAHPSNQTFTPQPYDPAGYKNSPTLINANLTSQLRNPLF
jgi:hypothetical protein